MTRSNIEYLERVERHRRRLEWQQWRETRARFLEERDGYSWPERYYPSGRIVTRYRDTPSPAERSRARKQLNRSLIAYVEEQRPTVET
jgi:hypothetical protein